jgi:hypothetical protein
MVAARWYCVRPSFGRTLCGLAPSGQTAQAEVYWLRVLLLLTATGCRRAAEKAVTPRAGTQPQRTQPALDASLTSA